MTGYIIEKKGDLVYKAFNDVPIKDIQELYKLLNWTEKSKDVIQEFLDDTIVFINVWKGKELIGMARAIKNSPKEVTIWDFCVSPTYQNKGIGSKIMTSMLNILDDYGIPVITLYAESKNEKYYEKFGFKPDRIRPFAMIRKKI